MANTTRRRAAASADSFAHLAGLGRGPLAAEENDDDEREKEQAARDEECAAKEARGEDTGETDEEKKQRQDRDEARARGRRARGEDPDEDGDDDSDREEMQADTPQGQAFRRGIARCAAIFGSPAAARAPLLAAQFAFDSSLTRGEAIRALRAAAVAMPRAIHGATTREAGNPPLGSGSGAGPVNPQSLWDGALAKIGVPVRR